jgi:hypothetical protein
MATTTKLPPRSKATTAYALLSEVRRLILAEPKRYHQGRFIVRKGDEENEFDRVKMPACGTVGCVAGWVATLKGPANFSYGRASGIARRILGISAMDAWEFFGGAAVDGRPQTKRYAQAGAAHIARFQREHAAELKAKKV